MTSLSFQNLSIGAKLGLLDAALAALYVWLAENGMLGERSAFFRKKPAPPSDTVIEPKRRSWVTRLILGVVGNWLVFAIFCGVIDGSVTQLLAGSLYAAPTDCPSRRFSSCWAKWNPEIRPAELLTWSWGSVRRHALVSMFQGLGVGFLLGLFNAVSYYQTSTVFLRPLPSA